MNVNIKEPSTVLAILLIVGMIVGPWFVHDRSLTRNEFRMTKLEEDLVNARARLAGVEAILAERKHAFEEAVEKARRGQLPEWPERH